MVLAASYEARAFGVRAGMAGWRAREQCPHLEFVGGHFSEYQRLGDAVTDVLRDFTPLVERISIDEAFLDVTGAVHLFGEPAEIASQIRRRVRVDLGLPISVGVATTKHLAKVASQVAKPDGLVVVEAGDERAFLDPLPVELLWGVGRVTRERLAGMGVHTIGELAALSPSTLEKLLGTKIGARDRRARGQCGPASDRDDSPRSIDGRAIGDRPSVRHRSGCSGSSWGSSPTGSASRLRANDRAGHTVTVRVRFTGLRSVTRSVTVPWTINTTTTLADVSMELALAALADHPREREVTLLAISVSNLVELHALQLELPLELGDDHLRPGTPTGSARWALDRAVDRVRERFGRNALGHAAVVLRESRGVPDEFRELAERD